MRCGVSLEDIFEATWIDPWYLRQFKEIVDMEAALAAFPKAKIAASDPECRELVKAAKENGFSDPQIATLFGLGSSVEARKLRKDMTWCCAVVVCPWAKKTT